MSDILDDALREQLAAALLGWGGDPGELRFSLDTVRSSTGDVQNHNASINKALPPPPATEARRPSQGRIGSLLDLEDEVNAHAVTVVDDIDADSITVDGSTDDMTDHGAVFSWTAWPGTGGSGGSHGGVGELQSQSPSQWQQPRSVNAGAPHPDHGKALPPRPVDSTIPASPPPPQMFCRLSRFPFSHPCDVPELMPDNDEDMSAAATTSAPSAPVTPGVTHDALGPAATQATLVAATPGPQLNPTLLPEHDERMRKLSIKTVDTVTSVNEDGVSLLTPTEASYEGSGDHASHALRTITTARSDVRSVSSLGSYGSSERQPSRAARKSISLFSRIRSNGHPEEEPLERRVLTPVQLLTPPQQHADLDDDARAPDTSASLSPFSSTTSRAESGMAYKFFRMPWAREYTRRTHENPHIAQGSEYLVSDLPACRA
ncbi:hypothetical protein VTJ49DRAFT_2470 [Mycothermus thermophilus]|uniref:Uncharacterized protein n=1 Tax=Humicola insolens TaxID=85995 RepID=A0ABR3VA37_HUMIN